MTWDMKHSETKNKRNVVLGETLKQRQYGEGCLVIFPTTKPSVIGPCLVVGNTAKSNSQ